MSIERDAVDRVHQARQSGFKIFKAKYDEMQENSRFIRLLQYSPKQLEKMDKDKRVPYVLDYLNSSMNTFQGIQRDKRTEIFYYPVESGDEVKTEILNSVKDYTLHINNFPYLESDVFSDGLIQKVGAIGYEWSREKDKNGALRMYRIPPRQIMWDTNSDESSKQDCGWISTHRLFTKADLLNRMPGERKKIEGMEFFRGEEFDDLGLHSGEYLDSILNVEVLALALIEFYQRKYEQRYFVRNNKTGEYQEQYFKEEKDAIASVRDQLQKFEQKVLPIFEELKSNGVQLSPPEAPDLVVKPDTAPVIAKTIVGHDQVFGTPEEIIDEPFYPIDIYHPFFHDRDWWCPLDIQRDGQRYFNKMFSMADHWIGASSKGLILTDSQDKDEVNRVRSTFATTGGLVQVNDVNNYKEIQTRGPAPQLFELMHVAKDNITENSGGKNFQGRKESASESGVAVRQRVEQGALSAFIIYDNHRRWKISVGEKMAWYLTTYMTYPKTVRILGDELVQSTFEKFQKMGVPWFKKSETRPGVGFLDVNTTGQNSIDDLKVDVIVDEAKWSVSKSLSTLQEINISMQSNPNLAGAFPPETILNLLPLAFSEKEKARAEMKKLQEQQSQLEMAKAIKPPAVSASLKDIMLLPPEAIAEFLVKYFKIGLDPNSVQDKDSEKMKLDFIKQLQDLDMSKQKHEQDMEQSAEKHNVAMTSNLAKTSVDLMMKEKKNGEQNER